MLDSAGVQDIVASSALLDVDGVALEDLAEPRLEVGRACISRVEGDEHPAGLQDVPVEREARIVDLLDDLVEHGDALLDWRLVNVGGDGACDKVLNGELERGVDDALVGEVGRDPHVDARHGATPLGDELGEKDLSGLLPNLE